MMKVSLLASAVVMVFASIATAEDPKPAADTEYNTKQLRGIATATLEDLRIIDAATDQWAIENNKKAGEQPTTKDLAAYLKIGTRLYDELSQGRCNDRFGNPMILPPVDGLPGISKKTFERLSAVAPKEFWQPFRIDGETK
jgi:hypothetical protein